jgi:heterodisulfide reductase subunit A-like polyferredoxin
MPKIPEMLIEICERADTFEKYFLSAISLEIVKKASYVIEDSIEVRISIIYIHIRGSLKARELYKRTSITLEKNITADLFHLSRIYPSGINTIK